MATNMYRVGDYVYFETSSSTPYLIRRIEELNKNPTGNVEAKVMCFYRRRDLPNPLVQLADKHQSSLDEDRSSPIGTSAANIISEKNNESLSSKQRHQIKHRELFLSRQVETLPATHIRGKCSVTLLNETESLNSYLNKDDTFFYCLVFDPNQKTLLADKGEIRVGSRYQSEIPGKLKDIQLDDRKLEDLETLVWTPNHNLTDRKIDQFLVVSRSIGTFARALDCSSSVKQPSLHMSAAAASRDITLFHAMDILHKHNYSVEDAMCSLVPSTGPVLCRDEIEDWSASEANLFEEALDKYGKDFNDIRQDFLPWKTLKQIVEYYYMWKTTDRYVQQKRVKAVEAELKLKQVYIPQYTKSNPAMNPTKGGIFNGSTTNGGADFSNNGKPCESCSSVASAQWYPWGPSHMTCRLCQNCYNYWKKYGGLKNATRIGDGTDTEVVKKKQPTPATTPLGPIVPTPVLVPETVIVDDEKVSDLSSRQCHRCSIVGCGKEFKLKTHLARHYAQAHGIAISSGSPRPIMKTRTAFYLHTNPLTRFARILCRKLIKTKKAARQSSFAINTLLVRHEFNLRLIGKSPMDIKNLLMAKKRTRISVTKIANRLGSPGPGPHEWLILTPKDKLPKPDLVAFPKPPKAPDGSLLYERIPNKVVELDKDVTIIPTVILRKRPIEEMNGTDVTIIQGPPTKRPNKDPMPSHCPSPEQFAAMMAAAGQPLARHHLNGKPKITQMSRTGSGRKQVISWMDAPDDVYFRATESSKKARKVLSVVDLRRAARKPWRNLPIKPMVPRPIDPQVVILD